MNGQDLLPISKFSELTGIKQSKLRYFDEINLFQPYKRGENGYRYYTAPQTIAVNCINVLQSLDIPIQKISKFKKEKTPEQILELLHRHEQELNRELFRLQQAYSVIHTYSKLIQEGLLADEHTVNCQWMAAAPIELGPANGADGGYFYESFLLFLKQMEDRKIDCAYPAGGFYEDMDAFLLTPGQPTRYFSHVPTGRDVKEAGEYLIGYTRGYYGVLGDLPERMQSYAKENNYAFGGPVYETYLHDEITIDDPDRFLIQASAPVRKKT